MDKLTKEQQVKQIALIDELNTNIQELIYWITQVNKCEESSINDYIKKTDEIFEEINKINKQLYNK